MQELPGVVIFIETESRVVIAKGWGWVGNGELLFNGFPGGSDCKESALQEIWVRSLGQEDPLEKGKVIPLQYSGLENSMDCIVHGVAKSWTQLSDFHSLNSKNLKGKKGKLSLFIPTYPKRFTH